MTDHILRPPLRDWLLAAENPAVRYLASAHLVEPRPDTETLERLKEAVPAWGPLNSILARQQPDGGFPSPDKRPTAEPTWNALRLMALCGLRAGDAPVHRALTFLDTRFTKDGLFTRTGSRSGILPCYTGLHARLLLELGDAERAAPHLDWICEHQRFDHKSTRGGGTAAWPYKTVDSYGGCWWSVSCYHGVVATFAALAAVPAEQRSVTVKDRLAQALQYLRIHRVFRKSNSDKPLFRHLLQYFLIGGYRLHLIDILDSIADADPSLAIEPWVAGAIATVEQTLTDERVPLLKAYTNKLANSLPFEPVAHPSRFLTLQWLRTCRKFGAPRLSPPGQPTEKS